MDFSKTPIINASEIDARIQQYVSAGLKGMDNKQAYKLALNLIDLTTLEGSDTDDKVIKLCQKAKAYQTAAVCVYPTLVKVAKNELKGSNIKVASVAGAFPAGQSPLRIKLEEIKYAIEEGADEIDMVISRGKFLEGKYSEVFDEIAAIKNVCKSARLKVIIETGELENLTNVRRASDIAIYAGADFIKTSTGKVAVNATEQFLLVMLDAIKDYHKATGKKIGMKPAGGIADAEGSLRYLTILQNALGDAWMNNQWFRFGASRLADKLVAAIEDKAVNDGNTSGY